MIIVDNKMLYIIGFAAVAIIIIGTFLINPIQYDEDGEPTNYGGSDDAGGEVVEEYGYEPNFEGKNWMEMVFGSLPGETESLLFAVQAALGAIIIGYFIGANVKRD